MKPSRIVKSAHAQAGSTLSLKAWAREQIASNTAYAGACRLWLTAKKGHGQ